MRKEVEDEERFIGLVQETFKTGARFFEYKCASETLICNFLRKREREREKER